MKKILTVFLTLISTICLYSAIFAQPIKKSWVPPKDTIEARQKLQEIKDRYNRKYNKATESDITKQRKAFPQSKHKGNKKKRINQFEYTNELLRKE